MTDNKFLKIQMVDGLDKVVEETKNFDRIVKGVYEITSKEIYGSTCTPGLAAFAYGSPGRIELIGGDSDADIFLAEEKRTSKTTKFREKLKTKLRYFDFSKVDITNWGTYEDIDIYLKRSLVEGNQVLETRFLIGDNKVRREVEKKKIQYDSIDRQLRNFIFNRLYFNQYFKQRIRNGATNIKYCPGGSRDFLFIYWHDKLDRIFNESEIDNSYQPKVRIGLRRLFENKKITERELEDSLRAVSFLMTFRSDLLKINKSTSDRGLTFLDKPALERLMTLGYPSPDLTKEVFERYRLYINNISRIVLDETIKKAEFFKGENWGNQFRKALDTKTSEDDRMQLVSEDPFLKIALIWGASENRQKNLVNYLAKKYKDTDDWATICSIVCSPFCPSEVLDHFARGIAKEKGYGYILRVIARNKNVEESTLKDIAEDPHLEKRYKEVAIAGLEFGNQVANNQV